MQIIPKKIREPWSAEEIRILVLLSLFMQMVLICLALFRKRSASKLRSLFLWASYLGADSVATLALGNLLNKETEESDENGNGDIIAFWAPFLLLHLGGPDAITAYSLEDNELWLRHLLGLMVHVVVAILVFLESLPSPHLQAAAIVVFAAGIVKYAERTLALWKASTEQLRESMLTPPDPGPSYVRFVRQHTSFCSAGLNAGIIIERETPPTLLKGGVRDINESELIFWAHRFFQTFKLLTVDLMLSFQDRIESQNFFLRGSANQTFRVVEVELSFLHDILHTKSVHVHSIGGRIMRVLSLIMVVLALMLFHRTGKHDFNDADVIITYVLIVAALGLEAIAIVLIIFSDWTIVALLERDKLKQPLSTRIKEHIGADQLARLIVTIRRKFLRGNTRKWSNSMRQYSLIKFHGKSNKLKKNCNRILRKIKLIWLKQLWDSWRYVGHECVRDDMKNLIFNELKDKVFSAAGDSTGYKRLRTCRGEWALWEKGYSTELDWSVKKEFEESILLWHIATLVCYKIGQNKTDNSKEKKDNEESENKPSSGDKRKKVGGIEKAIKDLLCHEEVDNKDLEANQGEKVSSKNQEVEDQESKVVIDHREISKKISDYMMYLVVFQPSMLPAGKTSFEDTIAEAEESFEEQQKEKELKEDKAYENLLLVQTGIHSIKSEKVSRSKSVLSDACKLANEIREITTSAPNGWKVVSAVWVEMLCYAASYCMAHAHAKQLSQGGELLTHVWLLMTHLGISERYRTEGGLLKLIVEM